MPGQVDGPASRDVRVEGVIGCIAAGTWLEEATGDLTMAEAGFDSGDPVDERTLAQVAVGHVAYADALVVHGAAVANWDAAVFGAVVRRLAPDVPIVMEAPGRPVDARLVALVVAAMPLGARRDRAVGPFDPLLAGSPPLEPDCGVQLVEFTVARPFHPERLHDALDHLLDGVVCSRGRLWLATQPDEALWMERAGGGLRVATGGPWLAAMSDAEVAATDPERVALAAARWDPDVGDRHTSLVVLVWRADPDAIRSALRAACLTDTEMAAGQEVWSTRDDPFGTFHADPCETSEEMRRIAHRQRHRGEIMKPGIHPDYHPVVFRDSSTGKEFLTRSTVTSDVTLEWEDGNRYPLVVVDVTSGSHPFWTGARRVMDTSGRVQKFERRYGRRARPSSGARSQDGIDGSES